MKQKFSPQLYSFKTLNNEVYDMAEWTFSVNIPEKYILVFITHV